MAEIVGSELVVEALGHWSSSDLAFIERLTYSGESAEADSSLRLEALFQTRSRSGVWPSSERPFFRVVLLFGHITELSLRNFSSVPMQIVGFDIKDVSGDQLERIKFDIGDYEDDKIAFYCESVRVLSVEKAD